MTRKALFEKARRKPKYSTRSNNRCNKCGRSRAFIRKFGLCRLCFRLLASRGLIPGVRKSSF